MSLILLQRVSHAPCFVNYFGDALYAFIIAASSADWLTEIVDYAPWPTGDITKKALDVTRGTISSTSRPSKTATPVVASRHC